MLSAGLQARERRRVDSRRWSSSASASGLPGWTPTPVGGSTSRRRSAGPRQPRRRCTGASVCCAGARRLPTEARRGGLPPRARLRRRRRGAALGGAGRSRARSRTAGRSRRTASSPSTGRTLSSVSGRMVARGRSRTRCGRCSRADRTGLGTEPNQPFVGKAEREGFEPPGPRERAGCFQGSCNQPDSATAPSMSVSRSVTERRSARHSLMRYSAPCPSRTNNQSYALSLVRLTT